MREKKYTILNPLNHNAFICESVDTKEKYVFFGKGIGFKKRRERYLSIITMYKIQCLY